MNVKVIRYHNSLGFQPQPQRQSLDCGGPTINLVVEIILLMNPGLESLREIGFLVYCPHHGFPIKVIVKCALRCLFHPIEH